MPDTNYSSKLRNYAKSYYNQAISLDEYRARRSELLDKIDIAYNGSSSAGGMQAQEEQNNDSSVD